MCIRDRFKSLTVASSVKIGGVNFNVTAVGAKAFTGRKYLTTVVIGGNVKDVYKRQGNNKDAKVTFDDKCSMPEKYYMAPSMNTTGSSVITYGQNIYLSLIHIWL